MATWMIGGRADNWGQSRPKSREFRALDTISALAAIGLLIGVTASTWLSEAADTEEAGKQAAAGAGASEFADRERIATFYVGAPFYYRSDIHITRPDGTDLTLKRLGWDGDALYFPIDGGLRSTEWWGSTGFMIDFLHNKAIARVGKGAHGRRLANPVIEDVDASGTLKGAPAPARIKLTDVVERLEFTHGHNVLMFTPMVRLGAITPKIRPYFGLGLGFALPHVEIWFAGEGRENRTNEYQFAGPAAQAVAGLEIRTGRVSTLVEYKFTWAALSGALTGDESWKNFNMPGDLTRQFLRWWRGEKPRLGTFETHLSAHQIVVGVGTKF